MEKLSIKERVYIKPMSIENWPSKILVYTDGASRGNPGPCALGVSVLDTDKNVIHEESWYLEDS